MTKEMDRRDLEADLAAAQRDEYFLQTVLESVRQRKSRLEAPLSKAREWSMPCAHTDMAARCSKRTRAVHPCVRR